MAKKNAHYKLLYFDARGIAEPIRYIFAFAGVDYQDERISFDSSISKPANQTDWLAKKSATPFHQVPVLEVDGKTIGQSMAIARFLARRFNLAGRNDHEEALVDGLADYIADMCHPLRQIYWDDNEERKKRARDKYFGETVHEYLKTFEEHLRRNGEGKGFFVGDGPTWVDFSFANAVGNLQAKEPTAMERYPLLKAHEERVGNLEGIKEWISRRPKTFI